MMTEQQWPSPAKINLCIKINRQRPDGYHDIQTVFQLLEWGDTLRVNCIKKNQLRRIGSNLGIPEADDLIIRAARLLKQETQCSLGAEIQVVKRIPAGAGLGGGSSNAATVLLVLNKLWGCGLDLNELARIGLKLGADVPVFVAGRSAFAEGVGEKLCPIDLGERHYLIVMPDIHVSTGAVFSSTDLPRDSKKISLKDALSENVQNDCEPTVLRLIPELAEVKKMLMEFSNHWQPMLTGTGSAFFLRFEGIKEAEAAAKKIKCRYNVRAVRGVDRSPLHTLLDMVN